MQKPGLGNFLQMHKADIAKGPNALIFAEDDVELGSSIAHARKIGFQNVIVLGASAIIQSIPESDGVFGVDYDVHQRTSLPDAINAVISMCPKQWIHYCYNGEYLFHPFCETRDVSELLAFHTEERREAVFGYVLDLYAKDLSQHPNAVDPENAMFDATGHFAQPHFKGRAGEPLERQLEIYGGLRWRFEEHIPLRSRHLNRIPLFLAKPGLKMRSDMTLSDEEMNTVACPWHHNLTVAVASFRAAKALRHNPGSRDAIDSFVWPGSVDFDWSSQQLLDLGVIETGQWF